MPKSNSLANISINSVEPAEKVSLTAEVPHIYKAENGIQFFDGDCTIRVANRLELRQKAYKLIYDLYLKSGLAKETPNELWLSIFDALPETTTFLAEDEKGQLAGALTVVFDSPIGLPADELYKTEIDELRQANRQICEIISFSINREAVNTTKILAGLFYCSWLFAWRIKNYTDFIITVHPGHKRLYCRRILFNEIGPEKSYAKVNWAPAVLLNLSLKLPSILRHKQRIFPLYMLDYSEREELDIAQRIQDMHSTMSDEEFYTFFIEKTDIWELANPVKKEYLKALYDDRETDHFSISRALAKGISKKLQESETVHQNPEPKGINVKK